MDLSFRFIVDFRIIFGKIDVIFPFLHFNLNNKEKLKWSFVKV